MQVFYALPSTNLKKCTVVTLGTFDGLHRGHRAIITRLKSKASELRGYATVMTFEPHPQIVLQKRDLPQLHLLTTIDEKLELFEEMGIDIVVVLKFDAQLAVIPAIEFVERSLYRGLCAKYVIMGYDHHFGRNREGNSALLQQLGVNYGFQVESMDPVTVEGVVISSTLIRNQIARGKIAAASALLGYNYRFCGTVVKGDGRGRALGFPTANLRPLSPHKLIPADGIYAVVARFGNASYRGILNIGHRPTFSSSANAGERAIEVHIYDYEGDLYHSQICVEFIGRIREEKHFCCPDELREQIKKDKEESLSLFEEYERSI